MTPEPELPRDDDLEVWADGWPCWIELSTPDVAAASRFYGALLGWTVRDLGDGLHLAEKDGRAVAGLRTVGRDVPSVWTTWFAVSDLAEATEDALALGATAPEPIAVPDGAGAGSFLTDPTGARFALWEAGSCAGLDLRDAPGALVWSEVMSTDLDACAAFYRDLFGHVPVELPNSDPRYVSLNAVLDAEDEPDGGTEPEGAASGEPDGGADGAQAPITVAGAGALPTGVAGLHSYWLTYFGVTDARKACLRASALRGRVVRQPFDSAFGRMALIQSPTGEGLMMRASS